ncbi:MAG: DUF6456 domain-containing protein, partial [Devosia sp.]
ALISAGAIAGNDRECTANRDTRAWLRRAMLDADNLAAQHRTDTTSREGVLVNLAESPLARLGAATGGAEAFLDRHHVEAGERVRRLVERAGLQPRLTMTYSADRMVGSGARAPNDISDLAADARKELDRIHDALPAECAGVVLDVCGWLKGLQEVERERGWPRRSAKLVLRIGLEQVAQHYGLGPFAVGAPTHRSRRWMEQGARPTQFG